MPTLLPSTYSASTSKLVILTSGVFFDIVVSSVSRPMYVT